MAVAIPQSLGVSTPMLIAGAFALPLLSLVTSRKRFFDVYAVLFSAAALVVASLNLALVEAEGGKPIVYGFGGWPPPVGIVYEVDRFGAILGLLTAAVMFLIVLYSTWYTEGMDGYVWYYTLLLGMEAGLLGCIYTGDAFNLFVMIEVLAISAYGLVAFYRSRPQAVEAAMKYAFIGAAATTLYFLALVFLYGAFGTLNMADLAIKATGIELLRVPYSGSIFGSAEAATAVALALALWTFTFKAALFPNHFWLPDAHPEAPTPVSAALSGLVVNVGVYATARFMYTIFSRFSVANAIGLRDAIMWILIVLGISSGLVGALLMVVQRDVKRLLAYSTISHIGLIFMGLGLGLSTVPSSATEAGLTAALYHTLNHSVGKALLFMAVGVLIWAAGTRDIDGLAGTGRLYPGAAAAMVIGFLQLMGMPPLGGFFSKLMLYQAYVEAGMLIPAVMVVVISAISILGYMKVIYSVVFRPPSPHVKRGSTYMATGVVLFMAALCIALGLAAPFLAPYLTKAVDTSFMPQGIRMYVQAFVDALRVLSPRG